MRFEFPIIHINERTSKFCTFSNCFKMAAVSCFMRPKITLKFYSNIWNTFFAVNSFETRFISNESYFYYMKIQLCKFCLLYLFEYLFNIFLICWNSVVVPPSQCKHIIQFWLQNAWNFGPKLHCGNAVIMPYCAFTHMLLLSMWFSSND